MVPVCVHRYTSIALMTSQRQYHFAFNYLSSEILYFSPTIFTFCISFFLFVIRSFSLSLLFAVYL